VTALTSGSSAERARQGAVQLTPPLPLLQVVADKESRLLENTLQMEARAKARERANAKKNKVTLMELRRYKPPALR
jgi:hypothetical protein